MPEPDGVALFTNEFPPGTCDGAGVHSEHLSRELLRLAPEEVLCFGNLSWTAIAHRALDPCRSSLA